MRLLLTLLVLGAVGYLGYTWWLDRQENPDAPFLPKFGATSEPTPSPSPPEPAEPEFVSRIKAPPAAPGEKRLTTPGVFYMLDRVSVETDTGIHAVVPGDQVKLLQRKSDRLKLTDGKVDFEVPLDKVTNDIDLAQEAEKRDVLKHGQRRRQ